MPSGTTSTIINTSGERKYFDFLPPAGGYMDAAEERDYPGDIYDWIRQGEKQRLAFTHALTNELIAIKNSVGILLYDAELEQTRQLKLDDGTLSVVYPEYLPTTTTPAPTTTTTAAP